MGYVLLVFGGRDYADRETLYAALDDLLACGPRHQLTVLSGGATGADTLAMEWAIDRGVFFIAHPADWKRHGRGAGFIRNQAMLDIYGPDLAYEFPGGRGTADMRERCLKACVELEAY